MAPRIRPVAWAKGSLWALSLLLSACGSADEVGVGPQTPQAVGATPVEPQVCVFQMSLVLTCADLRSEEQPEWQCSSRHTRLERCATAYQDTLECGAGCCAHYLYAGHRIVSGSCAAALSGL